MTSKHTATAAAKDVGKSASAIFVKDVRLKRLPMKENEISHPVAMFAGEAPQQGEAIQFTLDDGITYRGVIADAVTAKGEVMAKFTGPLTVVEPE
ncbi:hypothetical protein [Epibacterium ulvae]|uniref:hypothetical protein n=1 Tax=Epibacterium ulvae TaxID=1156985 RepID=UPI0024900EBC|nr:hypothetical protein [Epibacterium ulvae]